MKKYACIAAAIIVVAWTFTSLQAQSPSGTNEVNIGSAAEEPDIKAEQSEEPAGRQGQDNVNNIEETAPDRADIEPPSEKTEAQTETAGEEEPVTIKEEPSGEQTKPASEPQSISPEKPKTEKKTSAVTIPINKKDPLMEYFISYGGFFPVDAYEDRYHPGHMVSLGAGLYRYNLWGLAPELLFRYTHLDSKESDTRPDSVFDLFQISLGIIYRYDFAIHPKARKLGFFARITEGLTIVRFDDEGSEPVIENINTLGISAGLTYPVWKELRLGFELGYRVVFTAGDPMQGMMLNLVAGYRY